MNKTEEPVENSSAAFKLQVSTSDLIVAMFVAALFAMANSIPCEFGSGMITRYIGFPMAYSKQIVSGTEMPISPTINWNHVGYDSVVGILLIAASIFLTSSLRRKSNQKQIFAG